ncbi:hypothetical protein PENTCL1PPCAC_23544, partial [Pristionchus entomophagus]
FYSPSRFSDVVFVVEGMKLYASKQILAHTSSFFEKMFFDDFEKSQEREIIMDDVSSEEFRITLDMIYDNRRKFDDDNVEFLLKMADKYEITGFLERAEKFLLRAVTPGDPMNTKQPEYTELPMHTKLRLADQYKLDVLKDHILGDIDKFEEIEELNNSDSYKHYSREIVDFLMKKMVKFCKKMKNESESDSDDSEDSN